MTEGYIKEEENMIHHANVITYADFENRKLLLSAKHALEPKHTRFLVGQAPLERVLTAVR